MNPADEVPGKKADLPLHIAGRDTRTGRRGVLNPRRVRVFSFGIIVLGLFATALLCVLAIWDYASRDTAWRALATLGVLAATLGIFTVINEMFGARLDA
ncbi:MAG: hypothetical protein ACT4PU_07180 [Planctomycetota bacterium]